MPPGGSREPERPSAPRAERDAHRAREGERGRGLGLGPAHRQHGERFGELVGRTHEWREERAGREEPRVNQEDCGHVLAHERDRGEGARGRFAEQRGQGAEAVRRAVVDLVDVLTCITSEGRRACSLSLALSLSLYIYIYI